MAETHCADPIPRSLFRSVDPISLLLHQNPSSGQQPAALQLTDDCYYVMERGPRYSAYAELRESKIRMRNMRPREPEEMAKSASPPKKQVKFQGNLAPTAVRRKTPSILAQSVPDFSAALRKENRKPSTNLPPTLEMTPPAKSWGKSNGGVLSSSRGSKSASAGEKKGIGGRGMIGRKSYVNMEELKGFSLAARNAINGENRGGRGTAKTLLGYRQF